MATIGRPTSDAIAVIMLDGFMNLVAWTRFPWAISLRIDGVVESDKGVKHI